MKVFSLEKFKDSRLDESIKVDALKSGWPQKQDGKPKKECGPWSPSWEMEQEEWEALKMEFDKTKILTVVTADQAKVGQKGWFSSNIENLAYLVKEEQPKELLGVNAYNAVHAFRTSFQNHALFYPAPAYAERQAEWVKENGVKGGTKVRFTKNFTNGEDGSGCCEHKYVKGMEGVVKYTEDDYLAVLVPGVGDWAVPFTALEVIKEPTYRPYNNDELNDLVGEVLTNKQSGRKKLVTGKPTASEGVNLDGSYVSAKDLLSSFYRNTNEPCGIKE